MHSNLKDGPIPLDNSDCWEQLGRNRGNCSGAARAGAGMGWKENWPERWTQTHSENSKQDIPLKLAPAGYMKQKEQRLSTE